MKTDKGYIYKIISPNGKIYIGQTKDFEKRKSNYRLKNFKSQIKLWNNCQKYNWNPIDTIEIIDECDIRCKTILNLLEIYWIKKYNSYINKNINGLNLTMGGSGSNGFKQTPESIAKRVLANTGKKRTQETRERMSKALLGKKPSKETIEKYKKMNLGKKLSKETKEKISLSCQFSKNSGKWIKGCKNPNKGKKFPNRIGPNLGKKMSEETKNKIRLTRLGKKQSLETINKRIDTMKNNRIKNK